MKTRQYHLPNLPSSKRVILLAIGFDTTTRTFGDFLVKEVEALA